jgi:hypothetical protein
MRIDTFGLKGKPLSFCKSRTLRPAGVCCAKGPHGKAPSFRPRPLTRADCPWGTGGGQGGMGEGRRGYKGNGGLAGGLGRRGG